MTSPLPQPLRDAFSAGTLSLFCGSGISQPLIPDWQQLLRLLLYHALADAKYCNGKSRLQHYFSESMTTVIPNNLPIIARFLRLHFGSELRERVTWALYANQPTCTPIINAIRGLCEPREKSPRLDTIMTFNFDDLIERELTAKGIAHISIDREGIDPRPEQVKIYHPHGYLPIDRVDLCNRRIVFSEDDYHDQFSQHFNWANLAQLFLLTRTTCLLIGIGLTDPNMRRLLDAANVLAGEKTQRHYIVLQRKNLAEARQRWVGSHYSDEVAQDFLDMMYRIRAIDAESVGLQVLWVETFDEVPGLISSLRT